MTNSGWIFHLAGPYRADAIIAMLSLVQFGAGNIGRGFLAERFRRAGWTITFVDVVPTVLAALRLRGSYQVIAVEGDREEPFVVDAVIAVDGSDHAAVSAAVAQADLVATAVGLGALRHLAPGLAAGLALRARPLDILVCENGLTAAQDLRTAILAACPEADRAGISQRLGVVRTSIGRMIPAALAKDGLNIRVEPYATLPVEAAAFRGPIPQVPGLIASTDIDLAIARKLYLHNVTHACLAYAGAQRGLTTIPACVADAHVRAGAWAAGQESSAALARQFGGADAQKVQRLADEQQLLLTDLFRRYANTALNDPVARVGRDPIRKLANDDRFLGAASLCVQNDVAWPALARHIVAACAWTCAADEPQAAAWYAAQKAGIAAQLTLTAQLDPKDPRMLPIQVAAHRTTAAAAMRAAGLVLHPSEEDVLEIADFGLGRYAEFGLAIHVYVNTDRCCAKELMMVPGQICPEHRHPPLDGDPGKEETFRVRQGVVDLFVPGHRQESNERAAALARVPADKQAAFTMFKCIHLEPGDQYTLRPNTPHWFVAGPDGAIVSEFSTRSRDEADVFTDTAIRRVG